MEKPESSKSSINAQVQTSIEVTRILRILVGYELSGYQITQALIRQSSATAVSSPTMIYPLLHQIEGMGLIQGQWKTINGRHRRYYSLTESGLESVQPNHRHTDQPDDNTLH